MRLERFQVDAFAERLFEGNPAAVLSLVDWLPDPILQAIAEKRRIGVPEDRAMLEPLEAVLAQRPQARQGHPALSRPIASCRTRP